jgi:hypothetical protein
MPQMHFQPLEMEFNKEKKAVKEVGGGVENPFTINFNFRLYSRVF